MRNAIRKVSEGADNMDYPRLLKKLRWPVALLLLVCYASVSWAQTEPGQPPWAQERARLKMTLQEKDPAAFARATHATDRGVAAMNVAQLSIYTFNFGNQLGRIFTPGRADFPNPEGTDYQLIVRDLSGKVVMMEAPVTNSKHVLDRGNLEKGLYLLELRGDRIYRGRMIVE